MLNEEIFGNPLILECIFRNSKVEDVKRFRQVCRQWNTVAIPVLKKSRLIEITKPFHTVLHYDQLLDYSQLGTEFTAFKIYSDKDDKEEFEWEETEFTQILEDLRNRMTRLTIHKVKLKPRPRNRNASEFDLTPHINPSLIKLHIKGIRGHDVDKMVISSDRCVSLQFLSLIECSLKIANGIKINPVELTLKGITCKSDDNLETLSLNEFFNFDRLKSLTLGSVWYSRSRNLSFHFRDTINVERVHLTGYDDLTLDFKDGKWRITEKFSLSHVDFVKPNEMQISNFEIDGGVIQLAVLPLNLRKFKITEGEDTTILCSQTINLPELEILHVVADPISQPQEWQLNCLSYFNNCLNLTSIMLTIRREVDRPCTINIATIPKSVRTLYICGKFEFFGDAECFPLKQLHLKWTGPYSLYSILRRFKGDELAVDLRYPRNSDSVFETLVDISERPFQSIAIAHNDGEQESIYENSPLSRITNELSSFYIFANGFGTAIPKSAFEEIFDCYEKPYLVS